MKKILAILLLIVGQVGAQVTVGWDSSCDYDESQTPGQIQQAINDGNGEIRLTNQQEFVMPISINDTVTISGGYNTCADADNNIQSQNMTVINGSTFNQAVVEIGTNLAVRDINLDSIEIKNSQYGAINVFNSSGSINLSRLKIHDNTNDVFGGGLTLRNDQMTAGSPLTVNLMDVLILNNMTLGAGGGIFCEIPETSTFIRVTASGNSGVSFNHADRQGGGISLSHCTLDFSSGTASPSLSNPLGIHGNTANLQGGGLFISNASEVTLTGNQVSPVNITSNTAAGDGGGIAVRGISASDQSKLNATDVLISENSSLNTRDGGGLYVDFDAVANIGSNFRNCSWSPLCSLIENNTAQSGGAVAIENRGHVKIVGTEIMGNRARYSASVAHLFQDGSELILEGTLIHHNGGTDHTIFSDTNLITNSFGDNSVTIAYSTIADNSVTNATLAVYSGSNGALNLYGSIIDDPGIFAFILTNLIVDGEAKCNILGNDYSVEFMPVNSQNIETTPAFIDRPNQDYHLDPSLSVGIDRCEQNIYSILSDDLDGNIRGYNHPDFANDTGQFDIGVDEVSSDIIFKDSFE